MNSLVAYADSDSESEHIAEITDIQTEKSAKKQKAIPVLSPAKDCTTKQRVRISVPKLDKDTSDESDEDVPSTKRPKQGCGVGLTAILPQPKGARKEPEKTVKLTIQNMVPYSLMKRKQEAKKPGLVTQAGRERESDQESDEEPATFFSNLDSSIPVCGSAEPVYTEHTSSTILLPRMFCEATKSVPLIEPKGTHMTTTSGANSMDIAPVCEQESMYGYQNITHSSDVLPDQKQSEQPMDEEAFRRLAGGRNLKFKSESLDQIVELDESQVQGRIKDYQKYMTEEQPTIPKGPAPSSMQKKKHQLHYLIHQAQAREVELRNHWAQAAQNKRQSGMKYGFF